MHAESIQKSLTKLIQIASKIHSTFIRNSIKIHPKFIHVRRCTGNAARATLGCQNVSALDAFWEPFGDHFRPKIETNRPRSPKGTKSLEKGHPKIDVKIDAPLAWKTTLPWAPFRLPSVVK